MQCFHHSKPYQTRFDKKKNDNNHHNTADFKNPLNKSKTCVLIEKNLKQKLYQKVGQVE